MQHTSKMVMVPQDAYSNLMSQQKQLYSPVVNQLSNLDQELQTILSNPSLSEDAKYHQYMNVFGRYQNLKSQQMNTVHTVPIKPVETEMGNIPLTPLPIREKQLIESLPMNVRRKGRILLDHIKSDPGRFKWLKSGELVADGTVVPASNITDLVHHATRNRQSAKSPVGFQEFKNLLDDTNVPKEALSLSDPFTTPPQPNLGTSFSPLAISTPLRPTTSRQNRTLSHEKPKSSKGARQPYLRPERERKQTQWYSNWQPYK